MTSDGGNHDLPVLDTLNDLARLVGDRRGLYIRWSRGPATDLRTAASKDDLTGVPMSGLSANPLDVEPWWGDRSVTLWVARRLYDYEHLPREKGPDIQPWVLAGKETGRGPDNEPLVENVEPLCRIASSVIDEAREQVARQEGEWGPLRRSRHH